MGYPLFQRGGPQLRIFRPNFFMLAVRPGVPQPEDTVQFRVSMEMTKLDIRNYLEKIYNVPVAAVRTRIQYGANNKRNHRNQRVKKPDYKVAYVQLRKNKTQKLALSMTSGINIWRKRSRSRKVTPDEVLGSESSGMWLAEFCNTDSMGKWAAGWSCLQYLSVPVAGQLCDL
ncbi:hypothetical protein IHE44_0014116, partial [Lamprotornis superbus]